jgi:hypothetical protein
MDITSGARAGSETEKQFIDAIHGDVIETTFEDGLRYMEFTESVARSAQERRTITLSL